MDKDEKDYYFQNPFYQIGEQNKELRLQTNLCPAIFILISTLNIISLKQKKINNKKPDTKI